VASDDGGLGVPLARLSSIDDVYGLLIRLDAKLDSVMRTQEIRSEMVNQTIKSGDVRHAEDHTDHEKRIRDLELRPYISPKSVWTAYGALLGTAGLVLTIVTLINKP
jgi:hypothetical protein